MAKSRSRSPKAGKNAARPASRKPTAARSVGLLGRAAPAARLPGGVQRKIAVGPADDSYEREADAVADRVMSRETAPTISRIPASGLPAQREMAEVEDKSEEKAEAPVPSEKAAAEETAETPGPATEEATEEGSEEEVQTLQRAEAEEKKDEKQGGDAEEAQTLQRAEGEKEEEGAPKEKAASEEQAGEEEEAAQAMAQREEAAKEDETAEGKAAEGGEEEEQAQTLQREAKAEEPEEATEEGKDEKKDEVQANRRSNEAAMPAVADQAVREKGGGERLDPHVQRSLESIMNSDFSDVRVHKGQRAEEATDALNARAFTHGKDIWIAKGESPRNTRLMAHEATHVVQQTGRGQSAAVQRNASGPSPQTPSPGPQTANSPTQAPGTFAPPTSTDDGAITFSSGTAVARKISIPKISLPSLANKDTIAPPYVAAPPGRTLSGQRDIWRSTIRQGGYDSAVESKLPDKDGIPPPGNAPANAPRIFFLKVQNEKSYISGTVADIKELAKLPNWDQNGNRGLPLEVDHIKEAQLKGSNDITNFQLLDRVTNSNVGNAIREEIRNRIDKAAAQYVGTNRQWPGAAPSADSLRAQCEEIKFEAKDSKGMAGSAKLWEVGQIRAGRQIDVLQKLTPTEVQAQKLMGSPTKLLLSIGESASAPKQIAWGPEGPVRLSPNVLDLKGFRTSRISYTPGSGGSLDGAVYKNNKAVEGGEVTNLPITEVGGLPYTARLDGGAIKSKIRSGSLKAKGASPIEVDDTYFGDNSLITRGVIKPTVQIFKRDLTIDLIIDGDDVKLSKTFSAGDFEFPGPIKVTEANLTISAGTGGLEAEGDVGFEIERVGKGKVSALHNVSAGFGVKGTFDFDKDLFGGSDAKIAVRYESAGDAGKFSGEGTLKIPAGKVKGVKAATVAVKVDGEVWTAEGVVEPDVPGVKEGKLGVKFDPNGGLEITGSLEFGGDIPRLKGGRLEAKVVKGDEGWSVEGKGSAELDIPGAEASVAAEYKNGLFKAEAKLGYEKGIAKGSITAGVTNMPVGDGAGGGEGGGGAAGGGAPGDNLTVYGQGSVTIRFTPWLEGTAGIKIAPDGKMTVTGEVALPSSVEVFPQKQIEKQLLSVGVDIPIVGVAVAGQRVGIFLNISGSLTASASIGPGTLEGVKARVEFDPEDESATRVSGSARFVVPAEAGLKLGISGALGAGIPIVSATAGLEISGELGVKGEASASANLDWSPQEGLNISADVGVEASPKFTFAITGFVNVSADLVLTEVELYKKTWNLASVEFGSDMMVGAHLPVKVENGELKDISTDDVKFTVPDVNPLDVAKGLIDKIA